MKIGIDVRELGGRPTGVGRYLAQLLDAWAAGSAARRHDIVCYAPDAPSPAAAATMAALGATVRVVPGGAGTVWEQFRLPSAAGADHLDVFFAPAYTAPLAISCPTVVTIHDLSYVAHPEWFRPRERWRRTIVTRLTARRATGILTDSEFSRCEVIRLLGIAPERVTVVPLGLGLPIAPGGPGACPREPLVLYVGSIFNRRRVPDLIAAFATVARVHPNAALELVGEDRTWPRQDLGAAIAATGCADRIRLRSWIADDALADLYARASAFAFLSEYEGFGLTPLEALANGIPAVVLDTPVAREVCGDAAFFVQPGDIPGTAATIERAMFDPDARARSLTAAHALLGRYSWPVAAAATLGALERAGGARP
ncbi:MAG: glycosyltransferase family 1 protein [Vicinamibacterales bacterium]|nr:glycosyltransferase family 1 protein [Vicinamibacterales bacterium]